MITQLSQDTINEYATDAQTTQEPQGADYSQGVAVGKTIPAKWWNWLFSAVTKRAGQSKADAQNMLTELQNTVTDAGITLDSSDNTQLSQAIDAKADIQIADFVRDKKKLVALWQEIAPTGLLPVPTPVNNYRKTWVLDPRKTGDVYWSVHGIISDYVPGSAPEIVSDKCIAFSKDLKDWYTFDPSTIDNELTTKAEMSVSAIFFKGTYYMCISGVDDYVSTESVYAIVSSQDAKSWSTEVIFRTTGSYDRGVIFSVFDKIMCAAGSRLYTSSDGANWSYTSLPGGSKPSVGYSELSNVTTTPVPLGDKYVVGEVLIDENGVITPLLASAGVTSYFTRGTYKLQQGNVVMASGYTVDSEYTVTPFGTGSFDRVLGTLRDGEFLIVRRGTSSNYHFDYSEDGVNFNTLTAPLYGDVSNVAALPICELNGKFYYSDNNDYSIFESTDLVHWVDTGNKATSQNNIVSLEPLGVLVSDTKYSFDIGLTWAQAKDSNNNDFCAQDISVIVADEFFTFTPVRILYNSNENYYTRYTGLFYTGNYINRVIGHTLYLQ